MKPTICIFGGCNGAGKTTLASELLPKMGIRRFLNADAIAHGLSPLDPTLAAFRAGRLLIEESRAFVKSRMSFAVESTLSGKTHLGLLQTARDCGYRVVLHYVLLSSPVLAVERVALRVMLGGHHVPEVDIRRRFERSRRHLTEFYLSLADEWVVWDNSVPPYRRVAETRTHRCEEISALIGSMKTQEIPEEDMSECVRLGLEAGRIATAKMLAHYRRMGIEVTPQMTPAKPRSEKPNDGKQNFLESNA